MSKVNAGIAPCDAADARTAIPLEVVERGIYVFRGRRVMLDVDAAALFDVSIRRLHDAVKRNRSRFPPDFMFQLNPAETAALLVDSPLPHFGRGGRFLLPLAFTELGLAMLTGVLRSPRAAEVSVAVMREVIGRTPAVWRQNLIGLGCGGK